ncbi:hypothetical protein [Pseudarthrobacter sp. C1]|uniref:hypothetical protein n=1 Tax=Pseudarthrobacter sp. C1 TaxID=3108940 RepID=UPI002B05AAA7|nr:hypothetical protein [Pseudarthrobacter sp. C1]MEA3549226.1 hypothetical protein [Pseudarthrobacter sp. C1]
MMEDPVLADALQVFVQVCRNRKIEREDIVSADQTRHPWVFTAGVGEGWSFTLGTDATRRFVVDTKGTLYNATRTWVLRKVPTWYQVREGGYHMVATSLVDRSDTQFRDEILKGLLKFVDDL